MLIISLILIAVLTAADQIIKLAVVKHIALSEVIRVIHIGDFNIFSLTYITNKGAAWSIMEGKTWYLIGFPVLIIVTALVYLYLKRNESKLLCISLSLLIAGGIGNLIDRIRLKKVVDYILFEPIDFPIFNLADICVVIGVILLAVYFVFFDKSEEQKKPAKAAAEEASAEDKSEENADGQA